MTTINQALDKVRALHGQRVGNGQCYGLSAYYEHLITPDSSVGLGAGINGISGAVGNTINASEIGTAYRWQENGWTVVYPKSATDIMLGGIINIKAFNKLFGTGSYGHTAVITAVDGHTVTLHEQNMNGVQAVVANVYRLSDAFMAAISSVVYPPEAGKFVGFKVLQTIPTVEVNGDLFSGLITDVDPNIMNADDNRGRIDRIVIHHNAGTSDEEARRTWYVTTGAGTSAHYQVTPDKLWGCVSERSVAYHAGDYAMNQRSIGIEHLNNSGAPHWTIAEDTYHRSAQLIADICERYGIPIDDKHIIPHRSVYATACPGGIDLAKLIRLAKEVNTPATYKAELNTSDFKVRVTAGGLRIRKGAGLAHQAVGTIPKGAYTIVDTKTADGHTWGRLKSGQGWIALTYTSKL